MALGWFNKQIRERKQNDQKAAAADRPVSQAAPVFRKNNLEEDYP